MKVALALSLAIFVTTVGAGFQGSAQSNVPQQTPSAAPHDDFDVIQLRGRRAESPAARAIREAVERNLREKAERSRQEMRAAGKQLADMTRQLSQEMDSPDFGVVVSANLIERLNKMERLLKQIKSNAKNL